MTQGRGERGKFLPKSDDGRSVRSIRATDAVWMRFGDMAEEQGITRADLLERLTQPQPPAPVGADPMVVEKAIALLTDTLTLDGRKGTTIKERIQTAINLLSARD